MVFCVNVQGKSNITFSPLTLATAISSEAFAVTLHVPQIIVIAG